MSPSDYRQVREEQLGWTQGQLAEKLGVALNTVSRRELGQIAIEHEAELALAHIVEQEKKKRRREVVQR